MDNNNNNNNNNEKKRQQQEQDEEIKARARSQQPGGQAVKPGAMAVAGAEAARLDQRIAEKRAGAVLNSIANNSNTNMQSPGAVSVVVSGGGGGTMKGDTDEQIKQRAAAGATRPVPSINPYDQLMALEGGEALLQKAALNRLEQDALAKQRAAADASTTTDTRPGVRSVTYTNESGRRELEALESSIAAKNQTAGGTTRQQDHAVASLLTLEDRIEAKMRAQDALRSSTAVGSSSGASVMSASEAVGNLDSRIEAKMRGETTAAAGQQQQRGTATAMGRAELQQLEAAVAAKNSNYAQPTPPSRAELQQLEAAVAAKQSAFGAPTGRAELQQLEAAVAAKQSNYSTVHPSRAELQQLEAAVAAKNSAYSTVHPSRAELQQLEAAVAAKNSTYHAPNASRTELQQLEAAVAAKQNVYLTAANPNDAMHDSFDKGDLGIEIRKAGVDDLAEKAPDKNLPDEQPAPRDETVDEGYGNGHGHAQGHEYIGAPAGDLLDQEDLEYGVHDPLENNEGLAVAVPVMDEEENVFIPSAVEYDPDAKPPLYRNRRFRLYAFLACFILVVVAIGAAVGISLGKNDSSNNSQEYYRENLGIKEQVETIVGAEVLENVDSPYYKALRWITYKDPLQVTPDQPTFLQRYFMAYFYYATSVERPWGSCNPADEEEGEDYLCTWQKLFAVSPQIKRVPVPGTVRWLSEKPECQWMGVLCDDFQQVRSIDLNGLNMSGTFPEGVQYLPFIQTLAIGYGTLKGTLPSMIGSMKHLINFEIHYNALTGSLPSELWRSASIQRINVASNTLTGSVPSDITNLQDLKGLYLFENQLTGTMPNEIGLLKSLAFIRWHRNLFTGTLPSSLGNLKQITALWVYENLFTGTIPPEWGNATAVSDIRVQNNAGLVGSIPGELFETVSYRLDMYNCNFTGTLSDKIGNMKTLSVFRAANNHLHGTIPTDFSKLLDLTMFSVTGNEITGTMPASICTLRKASVLAVVEADCLAPTDGGEALVTCNDQCCTTCCDTAGQCVDSSS